MDDRFELKRVQAWWLGRVKISVPGLTIGVKRVDRNLNG